MFDNKLKSFASNAAFAPSTACPVRVSAIRWMGLLALSALLLSAAGCRSKKGDIPPPMFNPDAVVRDAGPDVSIDLCANPGSTVGRTCTASSDCSDNCFCNGVEVCGEAGVCVAASRAACDDGIACTEDACIEEVDQCVSMPNHALCSNNMACDGAEECDATRGCLPPTAPLYCNDENSCTIDSCDDAGGCGHAAKDADGDGYVDGVCGGLDCNDEAQLGFAINPGAVEDCNNGVDDNCNGARDYYDTAVCIPTNNTCETARALPGPGDYTGSLSGLTPNYTLSCGAASATAKDAVFGFQLLENKNVRVAVSGLTGGAVAIRPASACAAGPDLRCGAGSVPTVLGRDLPPGDYVIIVKGTGNGGFDLNLNFSDAVPVPPTDECNAATEVLPLGMSTRTGNFDDVEHHYSLSCNTTTRKDAAFAIDLAEPGDVEITATSTNGAVSGTTYISITPNCAQTTASLGCASGTTVATARLRRRALAAGRYFVLIESSREDATTFTVNSNITVPPAAATPGDLCGTAIDITSAPGTADLTDASKDGSVSCESSSTTYKDAYFTFTLTETKDVALTVTSPTGVKAFALQTACGVTASEQRCATRSSTTTTPLNFRSLPAGTYFVAAQAVSTAASITATIAVSAPTVPPAGDTCANAIPITPGSFVTQNFTGMENDLSVCGSSVTAYADAIYTFTLTERRRVLIVGENTSSSTIDWAYVGVLNACPTTTALQCRSADQVVHNTELDPGTYYIVIRSDSTDPVTLSFALL